MEKNYTKKLVKLKLENIPEVEEKDKIYIMNMNLQNTLVFY